MTLLELQEVLGQRIEIANNSKELKAEVRKRDIEQSQLICALAKQMINNADIILRTNKLQTQVNLTDSQIQGLITK